MPLANVSRPMGFIPYAPAGKRAGNVVTRPTPSPRGAAGGGNASTDLAIGDAYTLDANGAVHRAGPTDTVRGIVIGFFMQASPLVMNGAGPVSTDYVTGTVSAPFTFPLTLGCEDAEAEFWCYCDTLAQANIGSPFNLADAAPDPVYRQSRQTINVGGGAGTQFRVMSLVNSPADNAYGAFARIVVRMLTTFQE
jgi:hypothetical protein